MGSFTLDGITLRHDDEGDGPPLVLVHGHPFNRSMWRPQVEHFSRRGWRVITPDLRGYGESAVVPGKTTLDVFARDLLRLIDQLELDRIVLGGLSMGGQIVMEFHRLFPERLTGLVLADTFAQAETEAGKQQRNSLADRLLREGMEPYADAVLSKMITPQNIRDIPELAQQVLKMMRTTPAAGAAAALRGRAERPDYTEMLTRIAVPTLIVVGSDDAFTPVSDAEFMHARIPASSLAVIDGAGHMPNLERPAEFNAALQRFLDGLGMAGGR